MQVLASLQLAHTTVGNSRAPQIEPGQLREPVEATQAEGSVAAFESYLRYAREASLPPQRPPVDPRISSYLDALAKDFQPLFPNTLPGPAPTGAASR